MNKKYSICDYRNKLIHIMKEIRSSMGTLCSDPSATYLYFEKTLLPPVGSDGYKKNYMMPFLILVTNPCSHILKYGGCTMCGYSNLASFARNITGDVIYEQFKRGFEVIKKIPHHEMVAIGTAGSFLDPDEVPYDVQARIIKELDSCADIHYINIEARAEYVTRESLKNIVRLVDNPDKLSIGVGLESSNDLIRELCVNKDLPIELFGKAVALLREYRISPTVYVTIGKPFINDWTSITDAVESIKFAFQQSTDRVVLLRLGIQPNSLLEQLFRNSLYRPIEIWAILEVLKRLPRTLCKDVLIANPRLPKQIEVKESPCAQTAMELLNEYKGTLDYSYIEAIDMISSMDKKEWYEKLEREMNEGQSAEVQIMENYNNWLNLWEHEQEKRLSHS